MSEMNLMIEGLEKLNIKITNYQLQQFSQYYKMLIEKNKVMNLTAITQWDEVIVKHFLDSLLLVHTVPMQQIKNLIDVGTGAGFPGIPIKIMYPEIEITLLDSLNKRINFLNEVITELALNKITAIHGRAEDFGKEEQYRQKYDLCVSRAVANLSTLSEYCLPFVKVKGKFISYKSSLVQEEIENAKTAIHILGCNIEKTDVVALPFSDIHRVLVVIEKEKETPKKYPRKAGTPAKEPIK